MSNFKDVIKDLKTLGREDAIKGLGELYEADYGTIREYADEDMEVSCSSAWMMRAFGWGGAQLITGIDYGDIHGDLGALDRERAR